MTEEEKILSRLLKCYNEPDEISTKNKLIKYFSFLVAISLILTSYFLIPKGFTTGKIAVVCGIFGGIIMYFSSYYSIGLKNQKYLKKYINKEELEARLNEIKT